MLYIIIMDLYSIVERWSNVTVDEAYESYNKTLGILRYVYLLQDISYILI